MAETIWVLVANRSGARVFEHKGSGNMVKIESIDHPDGHLKTGDIDTSKPGQAFDSHGYAHHNMDTEVNPKKHLAEKWAGGLADMLDRGRIGQKYQRLILVMEPGLLGILRDKMTRNTAGLVALTIDRDLGGMGDREVQDHVMKHFPLKKT